MIRNRPSYRSSQFSCLSSYSPLMPSILVVFLNADHRLVIPFRPHPSAVSPRRTIPRGCRQHGAHISCSEHNSAAHVPGTNGSIKLRTQENLPRGPAQALHRLQPHASGGASSLRSDPVQPLPPFCTCKSQCSFFSLIIYIFFLLFNVLVFVDVLFLILLTSLRSL